MNKFNMEFISYQDPWALQTALNFVCQQWELAIADWVKEQESESSKRNHFFDAKDVFNEMTTNPKYVVFLDLFLAGEQWTNKKGDKLCPCYAGLETYFDEFGWPWEFD